MPTPERSKRRLIEVCYCSPNLKQDHCDFCMAKCEVDALLSIPIKEFINNEMEKQKDIDESFKFYQISPKGRLNIIFLIEEERLKC